MAGYFSNHSRFRFLANPPNSTTPPAPQSSSQKQPLPSSKHFSTSVSTAESQAKDRVANSSGKPVDEPPSSVVHPLRNTYVRMVHHPFTEHVIIDHFVAVGCSGIDNNEAQVELPTMKRASR